MVNILSPIVDATNRPSFYDGYFPPPLAWGGFSYLHYTPFPSFGFGWSVPSLWRYDDVTLAGWMISDWYSRPFYYPYTFDPWFWPLVPPPLPFLNPWAPQQQASGNQTPVTAPASHVSVNGKKDRPPPADSEHSDASGTPEGISITGPVQLKGVDKQDFVKKFGEGDFYEIPGREENLYVTQSGQAYAFQIKGKKIELTEKPVGTVRDSKLYPNQ